MTPSDWYNSSISVHTAPSGTTSTQSTNCEAIWKGNAPARPTAVPSTKGSTFAKDIG